MSSFIQELVIAMKERAKALKPRSAPRCPVCEDGFTADEPRVTTKNGKVLHQACSEQWFGVDKK